MRFFYILPLLLLPNAVFSMDPATQNLEEAVGPGLLDAENLDLMTRNAGRRPEIIESKSAPVVEAPRVVDDWELQRIIVNLLYRHSLYQDPVKAHQQLLLDGIDVKLPSVQRNLLDSQLKLAIQWALKQNYRTHNCHSNRPSVYGAEAVLSYIHHARTGGYPGTTLCTVKRLMLDLVARDADLALQLERIRPEAEGSKDKAYQMLLREGFQVERSRVDKIYYQYRGCWQWKS